MKKRTLPIFMAAAMLTLSACGRSGSDNNVNDIATDSSLSGAENTDNPDSIQEGATDAVSVGNTQEDNSTADKETVSDSDTTVSTQPTKFSVIYETASDQITADDGTVILVSSIQYPTVTSEEAPDVAQKINDDMRAFLTSYSMDSDIVTWAKEDYQSSLGDDGWTFQSYYNDTYVKTTRLDDEVISFAVTLYTYAGGAHGSSISVGRNYNAQTGEQIVFGDLSDDIDTFRSAALDYLVNLAESPAYRNRLYPETGREDIENSLFSENKWFFTNSGINFFSDPYAIGPYAAGSINFTLPYDEAANMGLKETYDYQGNYTQERYYTYAYDENGNMEASGDTEYSFDLNGDGVPEDIAFYGYLYSEEGSAMSLYINGRQWGDVIDAQLDLAEGYLESTYVLYDLNPDDQFIEIGVLYTLTDSAEDGAEPHTYFFRYTTEDELIYLDNVKEAASS